MAGAGSPWASSRASQRRLLALPRVPQKAVDVRQPRPGQDPLVADPFVPGHQVVEQLHLEAVAGGEVRVPAFRGERHVRLAVPEQARLAEAGARRDERAVPAGVPGPLVQGHEVAAPEQADAVGVRDQVVDEADAREAQALRHVPGVDHPGEVGGLAAPVADRAGDAEGGPGDLGRMQREELLERRLEARPLAAREGRLEADLQAFGAASEERQPGVGAADVAREDHDRLIGPAPETAVRASSVISPHSPRSIAPRGATHEPPTQATFGRARYSR